jgi:hypothetical protein
MVAVVEVVEVDSMWTGVAGSNRKLEPQGVVELVVFVVVVVPADVTE